MELASVIVLSYNGKDYLGPCLSSLRASDYGNLEVLLVDNASQDGSPSYVAQAFPEVRVVGNKRNLGFAGGMNRGIAQARGPFLAFLNQDTTVRPDWLGSLVRALGVAGIGVVGSKIYYPDGRTLQHAGGVIRYPQALADHYGYRQLDQGQWNEPRDVDYVTGAAFATRRDVLEAIGTFDEGFHPAYFEDADLCFRAREAGYRVLYEPEAVVVHHESATTVRDSYAYYRAYHQGRLRFVLKHYSAAQVVEDFYPAERAWLGGVQSPDERRALRQAYPAASRQPKGLTSEVSGLLARLAREVGGDQPAAAQLTSTPGVLGRFRNLLSR